MLNRCYNAADRNFKYWGGRGITVCPEWRESFQAFLDHIGLKPDPSYVLDRINNDGHYEPGNVRWTTRSVSSSNRRPYALWQRKSA